MLEDERELRPAAARLPGFQAAHAQLPFRSAEQAGHQAKEGGLPAAGRPDQRDEIAGADLQPKVAERLHAVRKPITDSGGGDMRGLAGSRSALTRQHALRLPRTSRSSTDAGRPGRARIGSDPAV